MDLCKLIPNPTHQLTDAIMATVTAVPVVAFKKSATPSSKRKIVDMENVENKQQPLSSSNSIGAPAAKRAVSLTPINSTASSVKKTFTGTNVNVNNQTNIINNNQQPKTAISHSGPTKSVPIINPSNGEFQSKGKPVLPQAVARRNARERNRVKQVNNGFAALRQHIPEEMAEAFELQQQKPVAATTAAAQKKLSKVETLRMAVEYIRNLENLLNISGNNNNNNKPSAAATTTTEHSFSFCDTSSLVSNCPSSPDYSNSSMIDEESFQLNSSSSHQQQQLLSYDDSSPIDQRRIVLPSVTTINGINYLRLAQNQINRGGGFLEQPQSNGEFIVVTTTTSSEHSDFNSGDEEQQQQQSHFLYHPPGMDQQQQIILYAPALVENNFQSNFVNNNLLAPAFQGAPLPATPSPTLTGGEFTNGGQSPVLDGDQIKIEQQPSRGFNGGGPSPAYVNKSPLIRHIRPTIMTGDEEMERKRELSGEESPPRRQCSSNEQFSVVDQSGVIIRGNFIEIKQEQQNHFQHNHVMDPSDEMLAAAAAAESMYDNNVVHDRLLHLKAEVRDEEEVAVADDLSLLESDITEEHMIDAMEWWENEKRSA